MFKKSKYDGLYEIGHKFGDWELIDTKIFRPSLKNKYDLYYSCRCKCGLEKLVTCYNLTNGFSTKCYNCTIPDKIGAGNPFWKGGKIISSSRFTRMKRQAKERGIEFVLEIEDFENKLLEQNFICALTGIKLTKETWSLDRIDSKEGYVKHNIQWVHKDINIMKNKFDEKYFIHMCRMVAVQAPFQDCDKETYEKMLPLLKNINLDLVIELDDQTDLAGEVACGSGGCEIK